VGVKLIFAAALGCVLFAQSMPRDQQTRDFMSRFTLHGEAMIEGYGPAAMATAISNCAGNSRADSKGKFVLSGVVGSGGNQACEVIVQAPGCEPRSVQLVAPAGSVALGTLLLQPLHGKAGAGMVSFWSLSSPPEALKLRQQAHKDVAKKKWADAERSLKKALELYDRDAEAWHELGLLHKERGDDAAARTAFERAHAQDPKFAPPLAQLTALALREQKWDAVVEWGERETRINPVDFPETWLYLATARVKLGDAAGAERDARRAVDGSAKKSIPKAHHILGVALAQQKRYTEAIAELGVYLQQAPGAADADMVRQHVKLLESETAK
jgi:tetratricopeptide (TPR) repeat protein